MSKRNPRKDPRAGDRLQRLSRRFGVIVRQVTHRDSGVIYAGSPRGGACTLASWEAWARNAEVLHVAE